MSQTDLTNRLTNSANINIDSIIFFVKVNFDRISSRQEFGNFENWKCIVCELKESESNPSPALKSYGWVGGGWVSCDYSVSSAPFVSELRL